MKETDKRRAQQEAKAAATGAEGLRRLDAMLRYLGAEQRRERRERRSNDRSEGGAERGGAAGNR